MDRMSTLPTIKCSSCGANIAIYQLADHVCVVSSPSTITPPIVDRVARLDSPLISNRTNGSAPSGRMRPPARIDLVAANQAYRTLEPPSTNSSRRLKDVSPSTTSLRSTSPVDMKRSATPSPMHSFAPRSPDLLSNLDSAFPRFPTKSAAPRSARPPLQDSLSFSSLPSHLDSASFPAPLSPRIRSEENAARQISFDASGISYRGVDRGLNVSNTSMLNAQNQAMGARGRTGSQGSTRNQQDVWRHRTTGDSSASHSSAHSDRSAGSSDYGMYGNRPLPLLPQSSEGNEDIDAFLNRLQTQTIKSPKLNLQRRTKIRPPRTENEEKRERAAYTDAPSGWDIRQKHLADANTSSSVSRPKDVLPSHSPGRGSAGSNLQQNSVRSRPLLTPAISNDALTSSLYTPSDSGFSDDSYLGSGLRSTTSSRSSPPESIDGRSQDMSKVGRFYEFSKEPVQRTISPECYIDSRSNRGTGSLNSQNDFRLVYQSASSPYSETAESLKDLVFDVANPFDEGPKVPLSLRSRMPLEEGSSSRQASGSRSWQPENYRSKSVDKGSCRGCSKPITGKSVKESSGRLSGRYHKQCFVCRTCGKPFPTAEFYVFQDYPYCGQHYHKINGSLCHGCDRGIEGQYLETETRQKFHPRCFICTTCRTSLQEDYYEVGEQKFCESHAQQMAASAPIRLGPGGYRGRNVQRRMTRLMVMS